MPQSISAELLAQMLRSITLQKRTGVLRVEQLGGRGAEQGKIYFESGSLVRVRTERETGKAAFQRISEWKQITCSFQSMSRPYPSTVPITEQPQELAEENSQPRLSSQTDHLARVPVLKNKEQHGSLANQSSSATERNTHPLNRRQADIAISGSAKPSISLSDQPLVLNGTKLEAYVPAQPAAPSRSVQRWTMHLLPGGETSTVLRKLPVLPEGETSTTAHKLPALSEGEMSTMPRKPPSTPRISPLPGEDVLPGRMAIFKVSSTISTAQAIQQMERHARIVFILLDGRRTIQDIARLTHQTEYNVEQILVNLKQRGYIQYVRG